MKKYMSALLALTIGVSLCGCGTVVEPATKPVNQTQTVNDVLAAGMAEADAASESAAESSPALPAEENTPSDSAENTLGTSTESTPSDPAGENTATYSNDENAGNGRQSGTDEGAPVPETIPDPGTAGTQGDIDVDLTALSSTMVYSEVYDMLARPELYTGKTVKMSGQFTYYHDVPTDYYYYACIIQDATACCSQGIEFEPAGDYTYPDDFPEVGTNVTVVGVFDSYMDGQYRYCTLRNAVFTS